MLIDLGNNENISIINLFDPDTKNLKLLKYHTSFKEEKAIFFFSKKDIDPMSYPSNVSIQQTGLHFFVVKSFQELKLLSVFAHTLQCYLIDEKTVVHVLNGLQNVVSMKYGKGEGLVKHQDNHKGSNFTNNYI